MSENFIQNWYLKQKLQVKLNIILSDNSSSAPFSYTTELILDPIISSAGKARSPKMRSGIESVSEFPSLRDAIVYNYKIYMSDEPAPLFLLLNSENKLDAFLISSGSSLFKELNNLFFYKKNDRRKLSMKNLFPNESIFSEIIELVYEKKYVKNTFYKKQKNDEEKFRINILEAYNYNCSISNCDYAPALEASLIKQQEKKVLLSSYSTDSGICMRADLHKLWKYGELGINEHYNVKLSEKLKNSVAYKKFEGIKIKLPSKLNLRPNVELLKNHCKKNLLI